MSWDVALAKAKRIEGVITKAYKKVSTLPIIKLVQMAIQMFDSAVLYGLGTIRKRHATKLKELDKIQVRVIKQASGIPK